MQNRVEIVSGLRGACARSAGTTDITNARTRYNGVVSHSADVRIAMNSGPPRPPVRSFRRKGRDEAADA